MDKIFEFKKLINKKGFYCKLYYNIEITNDTLLDFKYEALDKRWYNAVQFGTQYFFQKYEVHNTKGIKICFKELDSQVIDTTNMVVFFAVVKLLSQELNFIMNEFSIDNNGNFIIPK